MSWKGLEGETRIGLGLEDIWGKRVRTSGRWRCGVALGSRSLPWCPVPHPEDDRPTLRGTHVSVALFHSPKLFFEGSSPRSP